jgi:hypothetical protein
LGGEVVLDGICGDRNGEECAPLGEGVALELKDDENKGADVLDGGGLSP